MSTNNFSEAIQNQHNGAYIKKFTQMISIIIIVKNDIRIEKTLEKIRTLTGINNCEIIVVDASNGALESIRLKFMEVKWINYKGISDKKATYPEQRNLGIKKSKGTIIVFIDSDCIPEDQWLDKLTTYILEGKEMVTSGAILSLPKSYKMKDRQIGLYIKYADTANMAINKNVFKEIGLFDESFERCEDTDISIRIIKGGYRIRYIRDAIVYHDWGSFKKDMHRSYYNGIGMAKIYKKHKSELYPTKIIKNISTIFSIVYLLYILFLPVTIVFPYYPLLIFLPSVIFWRNPLKELFNIIQAWGLIIGLLNPSNK